MKMDEDVYNCVSFLISVMLLEMLNVPTTLPKFNITPEKLPPEKETSLPTTIFRGYVKLRECTFIDHL